MSKFNKIKSVAVTLRPRGGVTDEDIALFMNIALDRVDYSYIITEKEGADRHIHAALYLKRETTLSAFNQIMKRKFLKTVEERESIWYHCYKGKQMYNDDWVQKYLMEENEEGAKATDECVVLEDNLPDEEVRATYYSEVAQRKSSTGRTADPYYAKLIKMYMEKVPKDRVGWNPNPTLQEVHEFLYEEMMELRIRVISDGRKYRRVCKMLQRLICWRCKKCVKDYPFERGTIESEIDGICG